ncbi:hypothetical protein HT136_08220 [Novosphingobium profundi]|uniref:hypothetical protein n=1 Tax=Novosphingobium profundi TaxID=1774954 RepID=UPI001BDB40F3|nr:hypothetical protein [Novosphingobium profundi]MBT0668352.1 hypothetical protein [Novosphingobium profundi]
MQHHLPFPPVFGKAFHLHLFDAQTGKSARAYHDPERTLAHPARIEPEANGLLPTIILDPAKRYHAKLSSASGVPLASYIIEPAMLAQASVGPDDAGLFTGLSDMSIPSGVTRIRTEGWARPGLGGGDYVADDRANAEFARAHPRFCTRTANGRYFRLLDNGGLITVEQGGAKGDSEGANRINDRDAFQAALDYAHATGLARIAMAQPRYSLWCTQRRAAERGTFHEPDGSALIIAAGQNIHLIGLAAERTRLVFRLPDGSSFQGSGGSKGYHLVEGRVWRGCGLYVRGTGPIDRTALRRETHQRLRIEHLVIDGGTKKSSNWSIPANPANGEGWDITHKGIYAEADRAGGDIEIVDCEMCGWRGETVYTSNDPSATLFVRNASFREASGQGLNPNGCRVDVEDCLISGCYMGIEGWLGLGGGRIVRTAIVDCYGDFGKSGGAFALDGGYYDNRKRMDGKAVPRLAAAQPTAGTIDIEVRDCGRAFLGSWMKGRISLRATRLFIGAASPYSSGSQDLDLAIALAPDGRAASQVWLGGGAGKPGAKLTDRIDLRITGLAGKAAWKNVPPIVWRGSLGPDVRIAQSGLSDRARPQALTPVSDFTPQLRTP